ncbi:potassium/proton antiporter [Allohahella marinimesophila]|uniref:Potassium/proton antiporter n=2 Tax=Allohahella marinimesophila TaxID=1054972 RepID=A0ABP7NF39_9GAMM
MDMAWLLVGAALVMVSILVTPLSSRIGMPVLLLFLGVGMLAGEEGPGQIFFNDVDTAFIVGNLALAIILLDGGMRTRVESFRVGLKPALLLATLGVVITASICGLVAVWLFDLPLLFGLLIGAIVSSTDAAAVFSLLQGRGLTINERVEATLEIESGSNDPMAIFLTLLLIGFIQGDGDSTVWTALLMLVQQFGIGTLAGLGGGLIMARLLNMVNLVPAMYPLLVVTSGITLFSATNLINGSGFLAVYLMGIVIASRKVRMMPSILQIHDGLAWLAQLILFLLLGLLVTPSQLLESAPMALILSLALILIARPLATVISLLPFGFSRREHIFIGWVGLRGAVPIVLALFPFMAGLPGANIIFEVAFVVVIISLVLQGSTLAPLARKLKLEVPKPPESKLRIPLNRVETGDHELLLIPLKGKRWTRPVPLSKLHLPDETHLGALFRHGALHGCEAGDEVLEGDVLAVFTTHDQVSNVNKLLGGTEPPERLSDRRFFGEFLLEGQATLGDVQLVYGFKVDRFQPQKTLSDCFAEDKRGHPVVGDRLDLGSIMLTVRAVEGDLVTKVGLKLSRDE